MKNPDDYIEGLHDSNAPFNQEEEELSSEETQLAEIEELKLQLRNIKFAYNNRRKEIETLVNNIEGLESHAYIRNILKDLFL